MNHCSDGPATDNYDSVQATVEPVEKGIPPKMTTGGGFAGKCLLGWGMVFVRVILCYKDASEQARPTAQ